MLAFNPPVIAHRGASGYEPENTLKAFVRAAELGIRWVELDVVLAACGTPVIFHDETLDRTTKTPGNIGDHPYTYLRTLDAGNGEHIPTLTELADMLQATGLNANIEIKPLPGQDAQTVDATLQILKSYFPISSDRLLFSSFSLSSLRELRKQAPDCHLGLLMHEYFDDWFLLVEELNCCSVHVNQEILTPEFSRSIKDRNKLLLSYTVNTEERAHELFGWGVDAVFSDFPDRVI